VRPAVECRHLRQGPKHLNIHWRGPLPPSFVFFFSLSLTSPPPRSLILRRRRRRRRWRPRPHPQQRHQRLRRDREGAGAAVIAQSFRRYVRLTSSFSHPLSLSSSIFHSVRSSVGEDADFKRREKTRAQRPPAGLRTQASGDRVIWSPALPESTTSGIWSCVGGLQISILVSCLNSLERS
jgi:hypothetical protein